jgi:hypothetical protein
MNNTCCKVQESFIEIAYIHSCMNYKNHSKWVNILWNLKILKIMCNTYNLKTTIFLMGFSHHRQGNNMLIYP